MRAVEVSNNQKRFILEGLKQGIREDNRQMDELRTPDVKLEDNGYCELHWGNTHLVVKVSSEIIKPFEDRPNEGLLMINNELSSMANIGFDNDRNNIMETLNNRIIEKSIRKSNAIDLESLCIINGKKVWLIRVDVNILNYDGNLVDSSIFGTMITLLNYKLPSYEIINDVEQLQVIKLYNLSERPPMSLSILHIPVSVTILFFNPLDQENNLKNEDNYEISIFDATLLEEQIRDSSLMVTVNSNKEILQLLKLGGIPIDSVELINLCNKCYKKAEDLTALMKQIVSDKIASDESKYNLDLLKVGDSR